MIGRSYLFKRVTIVGTGLMGGSIGLAVKKNEIAKEVIGLSKSQETLNKAIKAGAIDKGITDVRRAIQSADLVILATPVDDIIKLLSVINPHLRRGTIVTDVGSTKTDIMEMSQKILNNPAFFVGSHPLIGSEKKGVEHAQADLFENAMTVMTTHDKTSHHARDRIQKFWTQMGAVVKTLSAEEHDEVLAYVSHVPHLIAYALLESIPEKHLAFGSNGLKDTTRIAGSTPEVWKDISMTNTKNMVKALDAFVVQLSQIRQSMVEYDDKSLLTIFTEAKNKHTTLNTGKE